MYVLRPALNKDLNALYKLTLTAQTGLTTLPADKNFLKQKLKDSERSFLKKEEQAHDESYLFVLVDLNKKKIVGCCGIIASIGHSRPFYSYQLRFEKHRCPNSNTPFSFPYVKLKKRLSGPSEVCSLYLHPDYRKEGVGRLLSLGRFMFMQQFKKRFQPTVIAEMRGYSDEKKRSPFWESAGKAFYHMDFQKADTLSTFQPEYIEPLIPQQPIYLNLLPKKVMKYLAKPHPNTLPALKLLTQEGFCFDYEVDIFDVGPQISCLLKNIRTVKKSTLYTLIKGSVSSKNIKPYLLAKQVKDPLDFKATQVEAKIEKTYVDIDQKVKKMLQLKEGDKLWLSPPKVNQKEEKWKKAYFLMVNGKWEKGKY